MNKLLGNPRQFAVDASVPFGLLLALSIVLVIDLSSKAPLDVVFILDEGAGLAESAESIKRNWLEVARSLTSRGMDCRFAVIPGHRESKQVPRIAWTADVAELEASLTRAAADLNDPHDAWPVTDCLNALEEVLALDFREDASSLIFLVTNSFVDDQDRLVQLAGQFRDRGLQTIVQANRSDEARFRPLYGAGGQFYTLAGEPISDKSEVKGNGSDVDFVSLLSPAVTRDASNELPHVEKMLVGVKVRGDIALVCDISGSMAKDFPSLVNELRQNFPEDTPLILVQGCHFAAPNSARQLPVKLSQSGRDLEVLGVDLSKDPHVYFAENTTDAILLAVRQFRRDTVMFNNDLQDGGSKEALDAFEQYRNKYAFTLSGRSLNRDAPRVLKDFIRKSGGDFKVDPINRTVAPAINWRPLDLVFILDEGAGLAESAGPIKQTWLKIARSLTAQGMDCRFAVLSCRPTSDQVPRLALTSDVSELERTLTDAASNQPPDAWPKTNLLDALNDVLELEFRQEASPIVFLITNSYVEDERRLVQLASRFHDSGIEVIIQANDSDQSRLRPLYVNRGKFYTLSGELKSEESEQNADSESVDFGDLLTTLGQDASNEKILVGVKVRGRIALVCDVSGSMAEDFPPLVKELREKFPEDTPLILVEGCYFGPASSDNGQSLTNVRRNALGVDLSNDPHVYIATNTTDAILLAVKQFGRNTVMFNNDLQDGGSMQAVTALDDLWKERRYSLSGRSLNCDAPQVLKEFVQKSGGEFKVDPINRIVAPAVTWSP